LGRLVKLLEPLDVLDAEISKNGISPVLKSLGLLGSTRTGLGILGLPFRRVLVRSPRRALRRKAIFVLEGILITNPVAGANQDVGILVKDLVVANSSCIFGCLLQNIRAELFKRVSPLWCTSRIFASRRNCHTRLTWWRRRPCLESLVRRKNHRGVGQQIFESTSSLLPCC
jgi:hypothetical protein